MEQTEAVKPTGAKSPSMKLMKSKTAAAPPLAQEGDTVSAEVVQEEIAASSKKSEKVVQNIENGNPIASDISEILGLSEGTAFSLVHKLIDDIDHNYFKLGGALSVIQYNGWFGDKGFESFRAYVEAEAGIQYRKAMYLIDIYNNLTTSGVDWAKVSGLGWTKLADLAKHLTPENLDEWLADIEGLTVLQIQELIKVKTKGAASGDTGSADKAEKSKTTTLTFKLHEDQKETIREALDKNKHEAGTTVDTVALENICLDYLGSASKMKTMPTLREVMVGKSVEEVLEAFDKVFPDVNITVEIPE